MVVSAYDGDEDGNENRICFWFRLDGWSRIEAAMIFADIDPDSSRQINDRSLHKKVAFSYIKTFSGASYPDLDDFDYPIIIGEDPMGNQIIEGEDDLISYQKKYNDIYRILVNPDINYDTPSYWLNLAIAKRVNIPWLEFASRKMFFAYDIDINGNRFVRFVNGHEFTETPNIECAAAGVSDDYKTDLLKIQTLAINEFFNPRKNVDAKQPEVTEWIKDKGKQLNINVSNNVAASMFTIIKPIDHQPKKKRVE